MTPPAIPYRECIAQTQAALSSGQITDYFRSRLGDISEPTLPFGLTDTQVRPDQIVEASDQLEASLSRVFRLHCRRMGVGEASFFHLVWALVIGRCSGQDDVALGRVLSGRM